MSQWYYQVLVHCYRLSIFSLIHIHHMLGTKLAGHVSEWYCIRSPVAI